MSDLISRQVAIDIVDFECGEWTGLAKTIAEKFEKLPPAKPEITLEDIKKYCEKRGLVILTIEFYNEMKSRWSSAKPENILCQDCKYVGTDATCCLVCNRKGMGLRPFHVYHDDYCSYAERKEE